MQMKNIEKINIPNVMYKQTNISLECKYKCKKMKKKKLIIVHIERMATSIIIDDDHRRSNVDELFRINH